MQIVNICLLACTFLSCKNPTVKKDEKVIFQTTTFYDGKGNVTLVGKTKFWQRNDFVIMEAYTIKMISNQGITNTVYEPLFCRSFNFTKNTFFDYHSFSDTAKYYRSGKIEDLGVDDGDGLFYSDKKMLFAAPPVFIPDTLINNVNYRRILFTQRCEHCDTLNTYSIGHFPRGMKYSLFSLEMQFSKQNDWFMQFIYDYKKTNASVPITKRAIENIADKLAPHETNVFNAWEKYAREHPVK